MPFTVSHVVAVLPFTGPRLRRWFDPAALVIGAMIPDLALFWPDALKYSWSHDLPFGPLTYDLALGLVVYLAWSLVLRRPLGDLAPAALRGRLPEARPFRMTPWGPVALSIVLGAYTHVLWDTFTHENRLGSQWLPVLDATVGPLAVYKWLQYGSGLFGLIVLGWWLARWWRRTPERPVPATAPETLRRLSWGAVLGTLVLVAGAVAVVGLMQGLSLERIAFLAVTRGGAAAMIASTICSLGWWVARRDGRGADSLLERVRDE